MYMRLFQTRMDPDLVEGFKELYENKIIPALQDLPGCVCATLVKNDQGQDEYLSMTLWDSQSHAEAYEKSELFRELLEEAKPFLASSSEWKIQLTEDFSLDYQPTQEEPVVTSFPVVEQSRAQADTVGESNSMHLRVVSLKTKPGMENDFKKLYREIILPALDSVQGCRYAYLTESAQESTQFYSVTIWDDREAAERYEKSGLFDRLTDQVKHTFSELFQWKMSLEQEQGKRVVTTDDLKVEHYSVVTRENFK